MARIRWGRLPAVAIAGVIALGCTAHPRAGPKWRPSELHVASFDELVAEARALAGAAGAVRLRPPESSDQKEIDRALLAWAEARRDKVLAADGAYARAAVAATTPEQGIAARVEAVAVWMDLQEDAEEAVLLSMPEKLRNDAAVVASLQESVADAFGEARAAALAHVARCRRLTWARTAAVRADSGCRSAEERIRISGRAHGHALERTPSGSSRTIAVELAPLARPTVPDAPRREIAPVVASGLARMNHLFGETSAPACECPGTPPLKTSRRRLDLRD